MLDFRLKVFYTVASEKSFTKAAHKHNITQPAVSKHIQELERIYGITLFERRGSSILLTEAGRILYEQAKNIDEIYREIDYRISSLKEEHKGELRLGASTSIAQYVLPEAIARFYNYYPAIKLSLISGNTEQVEQALLDKEIDLGFVEGLPSNHLLHYTEYMDDELVPITRKGGLYATRKYSLEDIKELPLVMREDGSGTLDILRKKLLSEGHIRLDSSLNVIIKLGSTESIKAFVRQTDCIAFISKQALKRESDLYDLEIISIRGLELKRKFYRVSLRGGLSGNASLFIKHLQG